MPGCQTAYTSYNLQFKHLADALNPERLTMLSATLPLIPQLYRLEKHFKVVQTAVLQAHNVFM